MKSAELLVGGIGLIFGVSQRQVFQGELMRSVGDGLAPEDQAGRNRWRPNGHTAASQRTVSGPLEPSFRREWWSRVVRDPR